MLPTSLRCSCEPSLRGVVDFSVRASSGPCFRGVSELVFRGDTRPSSRGDGPDAFSRGGFSLSSDLAAAAAGLPPSSIFTAKSPRWLMLARRSELGYQRTASSAPSIPARPARCLGREKSGAGKMPARDFVAIGAAEAAMATDVRTCSGVLALESLSAPYSRDLRCPFTQRPSPT